MVLVALWAAPAWGEDAVASVHTIVVTDCTQYFAFQTMGLAYSHWKARQPGPITRVMCCDKADVGSVTQEELDLVNTHIAPDFTTHPETGDVYGAYNKPGAVMDFLEKNDVKEEFLLVLDGDMLLRRPMVPDEMGARLGLGISARYDYLKGVNNELAVKHIPNISPRHDTYGGVYGRRADQVGGFFLSHQDDLRRVAPLWLKFTGDVRQDPDAWNLTGDVYATWPGAKPWISEMYGYAFGAATAGLWHKIDEHAMIYPEYLVKTAPKLIHYGLLFDIPGTNYSFDKHWHREFNPFVCPPWEDNGANSTGGMMLPHPPHPRDLPEASDRLRYSHLIAIETVNTLNEAYCQRHMRKCPPSPQLLKVCGEVHDIAVELEEELPILEGKLCVDEQPEEQCQTWRDSGECDKNTAYMHESCTKTCGACTPVMGPRRIFEMRAPDASIDAGKATDQLGIHAPRYSRPKKSHKKPVEAPDATISNKRATPDQLAKANPDPVLKANPDQLLRSNPDQLSKTNPDQLVKANPDQLLKAQSLEGVMPRGRKDPTADEDANTGSTLDGTFSVKSVLVVQLWMWGLVVLGAMSLLRMRTRAKSRYLSREEGLVGLI